MKAKEIIALNNEKREELDKENIKDYEDMLVYIRLSSTKSEQQTEEILLELLEHTLQAQDEDKSIKEVFGDDLKAYCQDLIEEIPRETKKKQFKFAIRLIFIFLGVAGFFNGIIGFGMYYLFDIGEKISTHHLGSSIAIILIDLIIVLLAIIFMLKWIRSSTFKKSDKKSAKWIEFLQLWLVMSLTIGLFISVIHFMPEFGTTFSLPTIGFAAIGAGLYALSYLFKN